MLKRVILVRHGEAESARAAGSNFSRRLTARGRELLERCYPEYFGPLRAEADDITVWASEAVRTQQTAGVICDVLGIDPARIVPSHALSAQNADRFIQELRGAEGTVIAVGHDPMISEVVSDLEGRRRSMLRGQAVCLDVPGGSVYRSQVAWICKPR